MLIINITAIIIFGLFIFIFEINRGKIKYIIDFMRGISSIFVICYILVPLYILFIGFEDNLFINQYSRSIDPLSSKFLFASLSAFLSYLCLICGYQLFGYTNAAKKSKGLFFHFISDITKKQYLFIALALFLVGITASLVYIDSIGGFSRFIALGSKVRTLGAVHFTEYGFLIKIAPVIVGSSILLFVGLKKYNFRFSSKVFVLCLAILSIIISLLIRFHSAGRLSFFIYIASFPLIILMYKQEIRLVPIGVVLFFLFLLLIYGDSLFNYFVDFDLNRISEERKSLTYIVSQFSFPFANIYHALENIPREATYRYFQDFFLGVMNLLPESFLDDQLPQRLNQINTKLIGSSSSGAVPVDIVTFGYYNLGLLGIILTSLLYGMVSRFLEALFSYQRDYVSIGIRVLFLLFWIFTVMYSDPSQVLEGGFYLIVLIVSFISLFLVKKVYKATV